MLFIVDYFDIESIFKTYNIARVLIWSFKPDVTGFSACIRGTPLTTLLQNTTVKWLACYYDRFAYLTNNSLALPLVKI